MIRRVLITLVFLSLLGFTLVQVGTLWSSQQQNTPAYYESSTPLLAAEVNTISDPRQQALFERFNQRLERNSDDFEARLLKSLVLFQAGQLEGAIDELRELTERAPKFQLAHLILGDLLLARFDQVDDLGDSPLLQQVNSEQEECIRQLRREARARLKGYLTLVGDVEVPRVLLSLSPATKYALVVDKGNNRLYIYRNLGPGLPPELVDDYYIVLGRKTGDKFREGDLRTPNGVYFVTSYLPDEKLPPLYGSGAFPVNYPNEFDRHLQKTGTGIWLHGTHKDLYSRPPLDSEGCVVLTNEEFSRIAPYVEIGRTPVIISEQVEWLPTRAWLDQNIEIQATLEQWRQSWEETDFSGYMEMYASDFWAKGYDRQGWASHKKQVFAGKTFQKIALDDLSLLAYPKTLDGRPMVVANFIQRYRSNNFNGDMRKRLYMVKEQEGWKVLYEGGQ